LLRCLSKYSADKEVYLGLYWTPRIDMEWKEVQLAYASGGAGYALSRTLLGRLAPTMPRCHANYTRWAGDIRVGKCVLDLNVRVTPAVGFHHEGHDKYVWDSSGGGFPYGHLSNKASAAITAPVSFHHLSVDTIAMYERMSRAEERGPQGELYRWDFSRFFLKEYVGYAPLASHRFRILFGISVEVAPGAPDGYGTVDSKIDQAKRTAMLARAILNTRWRRDFADPLYIRALPTPDPLDKAQFEMVIAKVWAGPPSAPRDGVCYRVLPSATECFVLPSASDGHCRPLSAPYDVRIRMYTGARDLQRRRVRRQGSQRSRPESCAGAQGGGRRHPL
jgi:hypothetical protein